MTYLPQPIIDLGKTALSKVADKFIDFVITKSTGKSIKVFQAEGDIEADKIKTRWELLEKPFWLQAEAAKMNRQYYNFGNTLSKSTPLITSAENKITDDNDVFWGLLEHSKEISNDEIQELIAKIIAGEYNSPGTYSMSTLHTIKMLGKEELKLFERICSLLIDGNTIPAEIFEIPDDAKEIMNELKIDFGSLQVIQSLGLFFPNEMMKAIPNPQKKNYKMKYFEHTFVFSPENDSASELELPAHFSLSPVGKQILKHLNPLFREKYFTWLKKNYSIPGYKLLEN